MRRLLPTVCVVVLVDMMLYSVLTPLLPDLVDELDLGKSAAGLLVAAYALGAFVGAFPAGLVTTRLGPKAAVLGGLVLLAVASLVFATADSLAALMAARFVQGISSSTSWTGGIGWILASAPRDRRGQLLGTALGFGIFGAVFGPVLGSLAALTSRTIVFTGFAVVAIATALWATRIDGAHEHRPSPGALRRAAGNPTFLAGLGLMLLPAFLLGIVLVLGPLHLSDRGWGAAAVGAVWLVNAVVQGSLSPILGRLGDRFGPAVPTAALLATGAALSLVLTVIGLPLLYAVVLVGLSTAYGGLYAPAFALIAHGAEDTGLAQGLAFAAMNGAWSVGAVIGPAAGGSVAEALGDDIPFLASAAICLAALAFTASRMRRLGTPAARES